MTIGQAYAEVIGDPIEHSKSPLIHRFWLERLGLHADYRRTRVSVADLPDLIAARRQDPHWRGCNVTMPLKLEALLLADEKSDAAVQAGACNLLHPQGNRLVAGNTDVGAVMGVVGRLAEQRSVGSITLLGTGGAARAVLVALTGMGLRAVAVQGRNHAEAISLAQRFGLTLPPRRFDAPIESDGLINATSLGMSGQPPLAVDLAAMPTGGWVFDLVSSPARTGLLVDAERRGLAASGGLEMLVEQAAASFPSFFGVAPPRGPEDEAELMARLTA